MSLIDNPLLRRSREARIVLTCIRPPTAEQVHAWVSRHLVGRPHPSVRRPINWMKWVVTITLLLGGGSALVTASRYIIPVLQNRSVWASISLISILLFTSGHMFNHIRKVPYVAGDGRGGISYFAGSFQSQYGMETQVVAAICEFSGFVIWPKTSLLTFFRWPSSTLHDIPCFTSTSYRRCSVPEGCCICMGWNPVRSLQLFAERFPHQERRVSLFTTAFHVDHGLYVYLPT